MEKLINIRAHHLLCIPRFYRGGYNKEFAKNMKEICQIIRKNPDTKIKVVVGKLDDLCHQCPYKYGKVCMQSKKIGKWVVLQDKKIIKYLKIGSDSIFKSRDIFNLSIRKINPKIIKNACKGCIFLENCAKVGINNSFKKDLNKN
jgi:uncharacterized protein